MLKRSKAWRRANQQGTVLLTVVIMVMVLFTLTSICLDVIHHSTRMSSKNVQKTQAKLTAEKVLTEFIEGYKRGKMQADPTLKAEAAYNDLKAMAGKNKANAKVIKVSMKDSTGSMQTDFDHLFGTTELHIYESGTNGFTVESICTYSTQTQTASCVFEGSKVSPYVPSNTIESQSGKLIHEKQLSNGAKGSVWLEKGLGDNGYKKLSRIGNEAHFYVEHNVRLDDAWTTIDVENHIDPAAVDAATGDKVLKYKVPNFGFKQAPTVTVDGYFAMQNDKNGIFTTVGKTDANMINPKYVGPEGTYDPTNLGNYDGYVRVDKKFLATSPKNFKFGDTHGDIDLYTHGLIVGYFPDFKINGAHDFHAEAENIKTIYGGPLQSQVSESMEVYGNVYVYKGAEESTQDGSLFITRATLNVHGDVFVEGNIYLVRGYIKCNKLHCTGKVYVLDEEPNYSTGFYTSPVIPETNYVTVGSTGIPNTGVGSKANDWITATSIDNNIDTTIQRNKYPEDGFDPQTGNTSSTKANLNELYGECSANDMFMSTVDDFSSVLTDKQKLGKSSAKDISKKYADAMERGYIRNTSTGEISGVPNYKGKPVVEFIGKDGVDCYYRINASVKLDPTQADNAYDTNGNPLIAYVIDLRDEDIVIALPTGNIGAKFRVDSSHRDASKAPFVYFMFYDPAKLKNMTYTKKNGTTGSYKEDCCLYHTGADMNTTYGLSPTYKTIGIGKKDEDSDGYGTAEILFGNANKLVGGPKGTLVGDLRTVDETSGDAYDPTKSASEQIAALKTNFQHEGFANTSNMNNTIMYLIPNDVGFLFSTHTDTDFEHFEGGSSGAWYAQGLVYGVRSHIKINTQESGGACAGLFGQVKGYEVSFYGDNKGATMDCPIEDGSLLGFVKAANSTASVVKLQYYLY